MAVKTEEKIIILTEDEKWLVELLRSIAFGRLEIIKEKNGMLQALEHKSHLPPSKNHHN